MNMHTVKYRFDPAELERYYQRLIPILDANKLDSTYSFLARNFTKEKLFDWLESNTKCGWFEISENYMHFEYDDFGSPLGVEVAFDFKKEAMLFKLAFGGDA